MPASILFSSVHRQNLFRVTSLRSIYLICLLLTILLNETLSSEDLYFPGVLYTLFTLFIINLATYFYLLQTDHISENTLFLHLLIDIVGVFFLLYFFGGYANPFIFYLLVPVTISAAALATLRAMTVLLSAVLAYSLLMMPFFFHSPDIAGPHHGEGSEFGSHLLGMWGSFLFSALLLSVFLQAMNKTLQKKELEINQQKEILNRNEQVVALGTLAADAAHELSTPLSTLAITIKELQNDCIENDELREDLNLMRIQVEKCKDILTSLTERTGFSRSDSLESVSLLKYIERQLHEVKLTHPSRRIDYACEIPEQLTLQNNPALLNSFKNIIRNAAEASELLISVELQIKDDAFYMRCINDGKDITKLDSKMIATPFYSKKEHGLGLGLFLAKSTLEQMGGKIKWSSRPNGGTIIQLCLPLKSNFFQVRWSDRDE